jgi:methylaspartate ammonia-lyase
VPLYAQSGDERYTNVDKMITKKVDAFPHGLINTVDGKLGSDGRLPLDYVQWVRDRIVAIGEPGFAPVIHIDVFDALGMIFTTTSTHRHLSRRAAEASRAVRPPPGAPDRRRRPRGPDRDLREAARAPGLRGIDVALVDEWCNALDDIRSFVAAGAADMIQVKTPDVGGVAI